jgi:hypothetical protein
MVNWKGARCFLESGCGLGFLDLRRDFARPLPKLEASKNRRGWRFNWVSSHDSDPTGGHVASKDLDSCCDSADAH